jgi:hypothetical protein
VNTTVLVLLGVLAVLIVAYSMRRKSRMRDDD